MPDIVCMSRPWSGAGHAEELSQRLHFKVLGHALAFLTLAAKYVSAPSWHVQTLCYRIWVCWCLLSCVDFREWGARHHFPTPPTASSGTFEWCVGLISYLGILERRRDRLWRRRCPQSWTSLFVLAPFLIQLVKVESLISLVAAFLFLAIAFASVICLNLSLS